MTYPTLYPGEIIRQMRRERGLTVYRLAKLAEVTQRTISAFEKGKISPTISTYLKIYKALANEQH